MSEPGKYVLLKNVQASSKKIKKSKPKKNKQLKKQLQSELKRQSVQISKQSGKIQQPNDGNIKKRKKKNKQKLAHQAATGNSPQKFSNHNVKNKKHKQQNTPDSEPLEEPKNFHDDLAGRLKASRFRFINEQLYTQSGDEAIKVFNEDDSAFSTYHEGYRMQVEQWPINPLDRIIKSIKKL